MKPVQVFQSLLRAPSTSGDSTFSVGFAIETKARPVCPKTLEINLILARKVLSRRP